jgi:hypothetical protein
VSAPSVTTRVLILQAHLQAFHRNLQNGLGTQYALIIQSFGFSSVETTALNVPAGAAQIVAITLSTIILRSFPVWCLFRPLQNIDSKPLIYNPYRTLDAGLRCSSSYPQSLPCAYSWLFPGVTPPACYVPTTFLTLVELHHGPLSLDGWQSPHPVTPRYIHLPGVITQYQREFLTDGVLRNSLLMPSFLSGTDWARRSVRNFGDQNTSLGTMFLGALSWSASPLPPSSPSQ